MGNNRMQPVPPTNDGKVGSLQDLFDSGRIHGFDEQAFIDQAYDFMDQGLFVDTKLLYEEALKKFPHSADLFFEFGYFHLERDEPEPARQYLMKVA